MNEWLHINRWWMSVTLRFYIRIIFRKKKEKKKSQKIFFVHRIFVAWKILNSFSGSFVVDLSNERIIELVIVYGWVECIFRLDWLILAWVLDLGFFFYIFKLSLIEKVWRLKNIKQLFGNDQINSKHGGLSLGQFLFVSYYFSHEKSK